VEITGKFLHILKHNTVLSRKCYMDTLHISVTSSVTAVLLPLGQRCGTVCLNSFGNHTSSSDNSNDRWKSLHLVSWAAAPCVWTL